MGDSDDTKRGCEVVGEDEDGESEEDETDFSSGRRYFPYSGNRDTASKAPEDQVRKVRKSFNLYYFSPERF